MYTHALTHTAAGTTTAGTIPQQQPIVTQTPTIGTGTAGSGALLIAVFILGMGVKGWKSAHKQARMWAIMTVVVMCLTATAGGLFGIIRLTVQQTGDSVGTAVTNTTTGR